MTVGWFNFLPPEVKESVWTEPGELERLLKKVDDVVNNSRVITGRVDEVTRLHGEQSRS